MSDIDVEIATLAEQLTIHEDRLPVEWLRQPLHYLQAARLLARCRTDVSSAELELRVHESTRDIALREHGLPAGIKQTEAAIENTIRTEPRYKELQEARYAAQQRVDLMFGIVKAFEQRYGALKALTAIFGPQQLQDGDEDAAEAAGRALAAAAGGANA